MKRIMMILAVTMVAAILGACGGGGGGAQAVPTTSTIELQEGWTFWSDPAAKANYANGKVTVGVASPAYMASISTPQSVVKGGKYNVKFACSSTDLSGKANVLPLEIKLQKNIAPFNDIAVTTADCSGEVNVNLVAPAAENNSEVRINFGAYAGIYSIGKITLKLLEVVPIVEPDPNLVNLIFWWDPAVSNKVTGDRSDFTISSPVLPWQVNLSRTPYPVTAGRTYQVSFPCTSTPASQIEVKFQKSTGDYRTYASRMVSCSGNVSFSLIPDTTDPSATFMINAGAQAARYQIGAVIVK